MSPAVIRFKKASKTGYVADSENSTGASLVIRSSLLCCRRTPVLRSTVPFLQFSRNWLRSSLSGVTTTSSYDSATRHIASSREALWLDRQCRRSLSRLWSSSSMDFASDFIESTVAFARRLISSVRSACQRLPVQTSHLPQALQYRKSFPWFATNRRALPKSVMANFSAFDGLDGCCAFAGCFGVASVVFFRDVTRREVTPLPLAFFVAILFPFGSQLLLGRISLAARFYTMGVQELLKVRDAVSAKATYANIGNAGLLGSPRAKAKFGYSKKPRGFILGNDFFGSQLHKLLHIYLEQSKDWEMSSPARTRGCFRGMTLATQLRVSKIWKQSYQMPQSTQATLTETLNCLASPIPACGLRGT